MGISTFVYKTFMRRNYSYAAFVLAGAYVIDQVRAHPLALFDTRLHLQTSI